MAILENTTDYATGNQVTAANLNALTETAKFVRSSGAIASTGNTTDESTLDINSSGELYVAALGIDTAQLAADCVNATKIADNAIDSDHYIDGSIDLAHLSADCVDATKIADNAVESEHLNDNIISGQTELAVAPADTDELLLSDNGELKKIDIDDFVKHPAFPQAYGIVDFKNGQESTLTSSYNVTSVSDNAGNNLERQVVLAVTMNSTTDYVVQISIEDKGNAANDWTSPNVYIDGDNTFTIHIAEADDLRVHFAVFGTRS